MLKLYPQTPTGPGLVINSPGSGPGSVCPGSQGQRKSLLGEPPEKPLRQVRGDKIANSVLELGKLKSMPKAAFGTDLVSQNHVFSAQECALQSSPGTPLKASA